jgi:Rps23 Pro-64 3,4-dihydroxylase Tpa1-like proline 4-hydroxylase
MITFPSAHLVASRRAAGAKTYRVRTLTLYRAGHWSDEAASLSSAWQQLCGWIIEPAYRQAVLRLLEAPEVEVEIEARATEHQPGDWMSRHTDRSDKVFSHVLYLCEGWQAAWGGGLALFASKVAKIPSKTVEPGAGNSVAFLRSGSSWHEVLPVSPAAPCARRALLIHGYRVG